MYPFRTRRLALVLPTQTKAPATRPKADARTRTGDPFITREGRVRNTRPPADTCGHVFPASLLVRPSRMWTRARPCPSWRTRFVSGKCRELGSVPATQSPRTSADASLRTSGVTGRIRPSGLTRASRGFGVRARLFLRRRSGTAGTSRGFRRPPAGCARDRPRPRAGTRRRRDGTVCGRGGDEERACVSTSTPRCHANASPARDGTPQALRRIPPGPARAADSSSPRCR